MTSRAATRGAGAADALSLALPDAPPPPVAAVLAALRGLRLAPARDEYAMHAAVSGALLRAGLAHAHEVVLGPRMRIDFTVPATFAAPHAGPALLGVEVKKGCPNRGDALAQLDRYAATGRLGGLVLLTERGLPGAPPAAAGGVPLWALCASRFWGLAT